MARMTAEDKKWRAEMDAQTLVEASQIAGDKARAAAAKKAAQTKANEFARAAGASGGKNVGGMVQLNEKP